MSTASTAYTWLDDALETIQRANWHRHPEIVSRGPGPEIELGGQRLINFASNDYLGLADHPELKTAATKAIAHWGTGSTGSRLLSGHRQLHQDLEQAIAQWKGTEAALVFSSGYLANLGTITALVGKRDLILADEYNHSSLKRGAQLSGATVINYDHGCPKTLTDLLTKHRESYRRCLIVTDGVFSMDGDICPLPDLVAIADQFASMLLVDDAHGTGTMGKTGAGCREHFNLPVGNWIQGGTLSKALGSLGGYVAGTTSLIDFLRNRAATWIYTTGLSPADTAAALAAIELIQREPERIARLQRNADYLAQGLEHSAKLNFRRSPIHSPILWIGSANPAKALEMANYLRGEGIFAPAIRPPTVPHSRLRFSVMASHSQGHIDQLLGALDCYYSHPSLSWL
ncbi:MULTISPECIES: 8-amino-7-oxononanoate synthase [unclassified Synechocystis]|uniref:8-amino-7-oxononanoate synthase n=1 Tax=unclassified Synechocystis TaxID=2640012 RepID=UPI0004133E2D|nr:MULTISPECIES: 8-amino-7-oxononanoate synthase [unclassified Synechocystis]AIE74929.1 8-amino-7-oxononanoate synthase [Synechocystis sp. PCC 6714]MCT0253357.1 8-amino-7-oxononanoate synthase [Synechocystis sp. CS-94]